jgi:hypothetical protein
MNNHRRLPLTLDSYELNEVDVRLGDARDISKVVRITIHGKNIFMRALEPIIKIGDVFVEYPEIQPDEQTVTGFLTKLPKEGSSITMAYGSQTTKSTDDRMEGAGELAALLDEPFTIQKLKRN